MIKYNQDLTNRKKVGPSMKSQRLDMIEEYVLEPKNASLDTLCEKFNVSKNTIRRDVDILLKRGVS